MKPGSAWGLVVGLALATALSLTGPLPLALGLLVLGAAALPRPGLFLAISGAMAAIYALILGAVTPGNPIIESPIPWGFEGAAPALVGMARLSAVVAVNAAAFSNISLAGWLHGLRLPPRSTAYAASILLATQDLARDHQRMQGQTRLSQAKQAGQTLIPLMVAAIAGANTRRDALRSAGYDTGPRFAAIVGVSALAVAARLAFVALPNVSLTFVIVFTGGAAFGARVGAWAGVWSMLLTDIMLSGLAPTALVNIPAMALVGAAGGFIRIDAGSARAVAATLGILLTFAFSVAADSLEVAMVPDLRNTPGAWEVRVVAGLLFNAVPALLNGIMFAALAGPVVSAMRAYESRPA